MAQWVGPLASLEDRVKSQGYAILPPWSWTAALNYSDPHAHFAAVPPRPLLHEGLGARLTAVLPDPANRDRRLVLRAFRTGDAVTVNGRGRTGFLWSVCCSSRTAPRFKLFTLPRSTAAPKPDTSRLLAALAGTVVAGTEAGRAPVILAAP